MIHAPGIWLCATLVLAAPPRERTEATRLFRLGNQQMDQGRYLQAIRHFERGEGAQRLERVEKSLASSHRDSSTPLRCAAFRSE